MAAKARLSRRRCYGALCIITNSTLIQRIMAEFLFKSCDLIYSSIQEQRNPIIRLQQSKPSKNHLNSCLNSSIAPKFRPLNSSLPWTQGSLQSHRSDRSSRVCLSSQSAAHFSSPQPAIHPFLISRSRPERGGLGPPQCWGGDSAR